MPTPKQLVVNYAPVSRVQLNGMPYNAYSYTLGSRETGVKTTADSLHHIAILDRSGSMFDSIDAVIDQLQKLFVESSSDIFWSVIWFNSPGSFKTLLKGAKYDPKLTKVLDELRHVFGTTCFSESITESEKIVDELAAIADKTIITLFSDGNPNVPNISREVDLCVSLVEGMRKKIVAFNCLGFSNYYDRAFMQKLVDHSEQGKFTHVSHITEFEKIYGDEIERSLDLSQCSVSLTAPGARILYQSGKFVTLQDDFLQLDHVNLEENRCVVFVPEKETIPILLSVNDMTHHVRLHADGTFAIVHSQDPDLAFVRDPAPASGYTLPPEVFYGYASTLYAEKKTKQAREVVVKNLGDKALADKIGAAFTYAEMGETAKHFEEALVNPNVQELGTCDASYLPDPNAVCVMEVLGWLSCSSDNQYVPFAHRDVTNLLPTLTKKQVEARNLLKPYQRVREKTVDTQSVFTGRSDEVRVPCDDLVYSEDRANISLRFTIPGDVVLNARAAVRVGLPEKYPVRRYMTHTFIKDGNLNIPHAEFLVSPSTLTVLKERKVPYTVLNAKEGRVIIHLEKMPVINERIMETALMDLKSVGEITKDILKKEALQKVLKDRIDALKTTMGVEAELTVDFATLTDEQVQVLLDHGVNNRSIYEGISRKKEERTDQSDYYLVRELRLYVAGISSLPSVASVEKKLEEGKKLTGREQVIAVALDTVGIDEAAFEEEEYADRLAFLTRNLTLCKHELTGLRNELAQFKIAMCLTGDFESLSQLQFDEKTHVAEFDGVCLKMEKVKQYT